MSDFASDQVSTPVREPDKAAAALSVSGEDSAGPVQGIALCLSGGGYRAMVFHLGVLWRLNEAGALSKLARISSVSGGSITAGVLGMNWKKLGFDASGIASDFKRMVVQPICAMAGETVDQWSVLRGIFLPGTIADKVTAAYAKALFGN
ncbi:MAG: patatin, partial [Phycisphaerales bacterium]|nr:patatin [Phycisphaerales bacterium]